MVIPTYGRVSLRRLPASLQSSGKIVLPQAFDRLDSGQVLDVGIGSRLANGNRDKPDFTRGQIVLFLRGAGIEVLDEETAETVTLVDHSEIIAIVGKAD